MQEMTSPRGTKYFVFSLDELTEADAYSSGFCIACGEQADGVEPDARGYMCECCDKPKVYGASELILMGYHHA